MKWAVYTLLLSFETGLHNWMPIWCTTSPRGWASGLPVDQLGIQLINRRLVNQPAGFHIRAEHKHHVHCTCTYVQYAQCRYSCWNIACSSISCSCSNSDVMWILWLLYVQETSEKTFEGTCSFSIGRIKMYMPYILYHDPTITD